MDGECCSNSGVEVISKDPLHPGPEGECMGSPRPDDLTTVSLSEKNSDDLDEKQKETKIQTLKKFVTGKTKLKNAEKDKPESTLSTNEQISHTSRELKKSISRVFSHSSSRISRLWSSFSATRLHGEGEPSSSKSLGKSFGRKTNLNEESESNPLDSERKTLTLGRRFSATIRSAFGRSRET